MNLTPEAQANYHYLAMALVVNGQRPLLHRHRRDLARPYVREEVEAAMARAGLWLTVAIAYEKILAADQNLWHSPTDLAVAYLKAARAAVEAYVVKEASRG